VVVDVDVVVSGGDVNDRGDVDAAWSTQ